MEKMRAPLFEATGRGGGGGGGVLEEATASDEGHRLRKSWAED